MYFFINSKKIYSMSFKTFFGNKIGFQAPKNTKIKIDYLRLSYLKKSNKKYSSYSYKDKNRFFTEEFSDNDRSWSTGTSGKSYGSVYNGYYTWKSKSNKSAWSTQKTVTIDQGKDFEIEARIKYLAGKKTSGIMLQWGKSGSSSDNFNFEFTESGKYWIGRYYNGKYIASKDWTASSSFNKSGYNKLTVRKVGSKYYFFMNGKFVHSMPFRAFYGNKIAFSVPSNTSMKIDYLKVSYLEEATTSSSFRRIDNEEDPTGGY
jgi:hypothetical protein